jgi:predicted dithiol-disulfide oxidoreductase (DUF899 family)
MSLPSVVSRDEWFAARQALLAKEKEFTRRRDALSTERRLLPMVEIVEDYAFDGPDGTARLIDMSFGSDFNYDFHVTLDETNDTAATS